MSPTTTWFHRNGRLTTEPLLDYRTDIALLFAPVWVGVFFLLAGIVFGLSEWLIVLGGLAFVAACAISLDADANLRNSEGTVRWDESTPDGLAELNRMLAQNDPDAIRFSRALLDGKLTDDMEHALVTGEFAGV